MYHDSEDDDFAPFPLLFASKPTSQPCRSTFTSSQRSREDIPQLAKRASRARRTRPSTQRDGSHTSSIRSPKRRNITPNRPTWVVVPPSEDEELSVASETLTSAESEEQERNVGTKRAVVARDATWKIPDSEEELQRDATFISADNEQAKEAGHIVDNVTSTENAKFELGHLDTTDIRTPEDHDSTKIKRTATKKSSKKALSLSRLKEKKQSREPGDNASQAKHDVEPIVRQLEAQDQPFTNTLAAPPAEGPVREKEITDNIVTPDLKPIRNPPLPDNSMAETTENRLVDSPQPPDRFAEPITCPICNQSLAFRSPAALETHVNACLDSTTSEPFPPPPTHQVNTNLAPTVDDPFSLFASDDLMDPTTSGVTFCALCGKDLTRYDGVRRGQHLNRCLDELAEEAARESDRAERETARGSDAGFLLDALVCPCCRARWPRAGTGTGTRLKGRVAHLKACAKRNGVSNNRMFALLKWLRFGYETVPRERGTEGSKGRGSKASWNGRDDAATVASSSALPLSSHTLVQSTTSTLRTILPPSTLTLDPTPDPDFQPLALPRPVQTTLSLSYTRRRCDDTTDEDLQVALTLSRSLLPEGPSRLEGRRKKVLLDPNVTTVVSVAESRERIARRVREVLGSLGRGVEVRETSAIPQFKETRVGGRAKDGVSLWEMATTWRGEVEGGDGQGAREKDEEGAIG